MKMDRVFRQAIVLLIVVVFISTALLVFQTRSAKAQDDFNFGTETVNKGYSVLPANRNAEDGSYESLIEADQYPDTNFSGSSENVVTGTAGGTAFPGALDTDDASRRTYTEASSAASPTYQIIRPNADGSSITMTTFPASPTTHYTKVNEVTKDDETSYNAGVVTGGGEKDIYGMTDPSDPGGTPNIDVNMWIYARGVTTNQCSLTYGLYIGTSSYIGATPLITTTTYTNYSYTWTLNPSTSAEWTFAQLASLSTYLLGVDGNPDTHTTQVALLITFTPTASYTLDAQITYNSVASTSQTTGFQVLAQGYRNGDTENVKVQAWNYTSSTWVDKVTISAGSDTDYNFNLLGWAGNCERSSGNVVLLRLVDASGGDATQTVAYLDVLKVNRIEKGYALDVELTASSVNTYGKETLYIKGYTSTETFNVAIYNWSSSAYLSNVISVTAGSNTLYTYVMLINYQRSGSQQVRIQITDGTASSSDTVQDTLFLDVAWVRWMHTDPKITKYGKTPADPNLGSSISWFLNYSDFDNEAPVANYPKLHIDSTDYTMTANDSYVQYTVGKSYHYEKSDLAGGSHTYYFIIKDANSIEVSTASTPFKVNRNPTLTVDGVTPATGNNGDPFTFYVIYTDPDGDPPSYAKVNIATVDYDMTANGTGTYLTGYPYHYSKAMSGGISSYYFKTKDANGTEVTTTPKNLIVNNPPALSSYGRAPSDPVYPTTQLNFTVTYTDADNDVPTSIKWREGGGTTQNVTMLAVTAGDVTYTDGKAYYVLVYLSHNAHNYDFYASDGTVGVSGGSNSVTIQNRNPSISNGPGAHIDQYRNQAWYYDFDATDPDGDTVSWQLSGAAWLGVNSGTGYVSGTTTDTPGTYSFTVYANDSYGGTTNYAFELHITNRAPTITNGPGASVNEWRNTFWSYDFNFNDADGDSVSWGRTGASWLSIDSNGILSGTTTNTPGDYGYTVYANDTWNSASYDFTLHILNRNPTITDKCSANPTAYRNVAWSFDFNATDADTDTLQWGRAGPSWLSIVPSTGVLSGTTTNAPGNYQFTVYANDSYSGSDSYTFTLTIQNRNPSITDTCGSGPTAYRNVAWSFDFNATDPDSDTLIWARSGSSWLTMDSGTGVLSGTTTNNPGGYSFTVYANDSYSGSSSFAFTLTITNRAPMITSAGNTTQKLGTYMAYHVTATDADSDSLSITFSSNASWLAVSNFWVNGTATGIGWYECTIWVNDSYGGSDSDHWHVDVWTSANLPPSFTSAPIDSVGHPVDYFYDANASDPELDSLTFGLESSNPSLGIDPSTGMVSGHISIAGTWSIHISVSDATHMVWQNFSLTASNAPPSFISSPIEDLGQHPVDYYYDANATDANGDSLVFGLQTSCEYLGINPSTGVVSGHIPIAGIWTVHISVSDPNSTVWQNFTINTTNTAPTFTSSPIESWEHGMMYTYDANANDVNGDSYSFGLQGNGTAFLSIIPSTGVITGIPPTVGWWNVCVSVSDSNSTTWQNFTLTALNTAPSFTSSSITEWQHGMMYYYDANASDLNGDVLSWYLEGNCTIYLAINSTTGVVNGILPIMGYWSVNISISDSWAVLWQNFTLSSLNAGPYFTTSPILTGTVNVSYYYHAHANDNNSDTLVYSLVDSPSWAFVDPNTGEVEGTASLLGNYDFHLRVWDGYVFTWQNWTLTIGALTPPTPVASPEDTACLTTIIMVAVVIGAVFLIFTKISGKGKPDPKPEPIKREKTETKVKKNVR